MSGENNRMRRLHLQAAGYCINGLAHGKATHGVLCQHCRDVHRGVPNPAPLWLHPAITGFVRTSDIAAMAAKLDDIREEAIAIGEVSALYRCSQGGE